MRLRKEAIKWIIVGIFIILVAFVLGALFVWAAFQLKFECITYIGDDLKCINYVSREYREFFLPRFVIEGEEIE